MPDLRVARRLLASGSLPAGRVVDVDAAPAPSFGLADAFDARDTGWHAHNRHQLLYSESGALHLEVADAQWLLPPQRAAFLAAGVTHRVRARARVALCTVYLDPHALAADTPADTPAADTSAADTPAAATPGTTAPACCVFSVTPLAREMLRHAVRWGPSWPDDAADADVARSYFATLALLARTWIASDDGLRLPRPCTPDLARAFDYALAHLASASMADAARAAAVSERTLARRFQAETRMSWRRFLRTARILRAVELLARPGVSVTEVALEVGFDSLGAFARAFRALTGEAPSEYQRRVAGDGRGIVAPAPGPRTARPQAT